VTSEQTQAGFAFFNEIGIIEQLSRNAFERVLPDGLSLAGFGVLNHFVRLSKDADSPAKLAQAFQVTKGAMTNTLQRLEALGCVAIAPSSEDGRVKLVRLTERGRALREACIARLEPLLAALFRDIDPAELAAVTPTLAKVRALLDAAR